MTADPIREAVARALSNVEGYRNKAEKPTVATGIDYFLETLSEAGYRLVNEGGLEEACQRCGRPQNGRHFGICCGCAEIVEAEVHHVPKEAAGLGEAWRAVEEALPAKRWTISLAGDWEAGWVADATWRLVGGPSSSATTREHRWGEEDQGLDTPEAALRALAARLAEQGEAE
jgi:hypothetical protein